MNQSFLEKISNNNSLITNISIDYEALESWKPTEDIKPFLANVSILYPLKEYKMGTLPISGLRKH